ncbi:MAG: hypothetical protein ACRDJE_14410 [Dehalococcoidia bacterium]
MASWNPPPSRYTVTETAEFLERAAAFAGSSERWDKIKETIDQDLARDPYVGQPVPGTRLYAIQIDTWPPLTIYYTIDDEAREMTLVEMRMFDPPPGHLDSWS